jgi:hypothetical protein
MRHYQGPRGSFDHPASALTLRAVLAGFGLVTCAVLAVLAARAGWELGAIVLGVLAGVAVVDLMVIQHRRREESSAGR